MRRTSSSRRSPPAPPSQPVMVEEPTFDQTIEILIGIRERYEQHHKVSITDDAVRAAADLSIRYITDRHLPDEDGGTPHCATPATSPLPPRPPLPIYPGALRAAPQGLDPRRRGAGRRRPVDPLHHRSPCPA